MSKRKREPTCGKENLGWICTLAKNHTGDHRAYGNTRFDCLHRWENKPDLVEDTRRYLKIITGFNHANR